jgi:DNA-binding transcriptional LysR family regulator
MDLASLILLVDILDAGNLSQAARNLKMTRANVSYHLKQLEKSVGVQLVRRTTRRVEPTEVGMPMAAAFRTKYWPPVKPSPRSAKACRAAWA